MIYTSYFSSGKYKPEDGVSIARWAPFWHGYNFKQLAPSRELLKWWKSLPLEAQEKAEYRQYYKDLYVQQSLSGLNPVKVAEMLEGKTLLCFEKPEDFCHRHIVANWLREAGFECEEL